MRPALLSAHLSESEFIATQQRDLLDQQERYWRESPLVRTNGLRFARDGFEPVRAVIGPCTVSSGYRCPPLNTRVGGAPTSLHLDGLAADLLPMKLGIVEAMSRLREALADGRLPHVDRIIFEYGRWLHVQVSREGRAPAHLALMTFGGGEYPPFDIADARVVSRRLVG